MINERPRKISAFKRRLKLANGDVAQLLADDLPFAAAIAELLVESGHFVAAGDGVLFGFESPTGIGIRSAADMVAVCRHLTGIDLERDEAELVLAELRIQAFVERLIA